jgi:RsiW-degrading membrane proteinase PrsW (M82 family)
MTIMILAATIPPLILMIRIYKLDKIEKEPRGLIIRVLLLGALMTIPAGLIESGISSVLGMLINPKSILFMLIENFFIVALTEELVKHWAAKKPTWANPEFNFRFDGIVYCVAAALGFAAAENILYVFQFGLQVAAVRAVTAIPAHCIFGITMGYYYGTAGHYARTWDRDRARHYDRISILVPMVMHGFYDFAASMKSELWSMIFLGFIIIVDIVAFVSVHKASKNDEPLYR